MPISIAWQQIALRLLCSIVAGALIGFNRDEKGRPAGMRTTVLVCMAAAIAMIQANLLMPTTGKSPDSFVVLDLMRLPLGILSGMGFIGAGAILRKDEAVIGVTTAAALWISTVLGLCFGGGQIVLGWMGTALVFVLLPGLKQLERYIPEQKRAELELTFDESLLSEQAIYERLQRTKLHVRGWKISASPTEQTKTVACELRWRTRSRAGMPPDSIRAILGESGVRHYSWRI